MKRRQLCAVLALLLGAALALLAIVLDAKRHPRRCAYASPYSWAPPVRCWEVRR